MGGFCRVKMILYCSKNVILKKDMLYLFHRVFFKGSVLELKELRVTKMKRNFYSNF